MQKRNEGVTIGNAYQWALLALERYRKDLNASILGINVDLSSKELIAVLIGKAQEGKTSLAIRLLGANDEEFAAIQQALRAHHKIGCSATKVAMIYRASGEPLTERTIKQLKEKIKAAEKELPEILELALPLKGKVFGTVIDLVGLEPRDDKELERALALTKKYLQIADVKIYVTRADHLANFSDFDTRVSEIMNYWRLTPQHSIFVLTYAYEVIDGIESIINEHENPKELLNRVRQHLKEEIAHQLQCREEELPPVFPVHLGPNKEKKIIKEATHIALDELRNILSSNPIEYRLIAGFEYPRRIKEKLDKLKEKYKSKKCKISQIESDILNLQAKKEDIKNQIAVTEERIENLKRVPQNCVIKFETEVKNISLPHKEPKRGQKVQLLTIAANEFIDSLEKKISEIVKNYINEYYQLGSLFEKLKWKINEYLETRRDIKNYKIIVKGFLGGVKWEESWHRLKKWAEETRWNVCKIWKETLGITQYKLPGEVMNLNYPLPEEIKKQIVDYEKKIKRYLNLIKNIEDQISNKIEEKNKLLREKDDLKEQIKDFEKAHKHPLKYSQYLAEEFVRFWNKTIENINTLQDPLEILQNVALLRKAFILLERLEGKRRESDE